jgi:hypothetical protein
MQSNRARAERFLSHLQPSPAAGAQPVQPSEAQVAHQPSPSAQFAAVLQGHRPEVEFVDHRSPEDQCLRNQPVDGADAIRQLQFSSPASNPNDSSLEVSPASLSSSPLASSLPPSPASVLTSPDREPAGESPSGNCLRAAVSPLRADAAPFYPGHAIFTGREYSHLQSSDQDSSCSSDSDSRRHRGLHHARD